MDSLQEAISFFTKSLNAELEKNLTPELVDYLSYKSLHSYGVLVAAQRIISLDPKLQATKKETKEEFQIAAILHDIGRLSQHDTKTRLKNSAYPHGEIGYDILKKAGMHNPRILLAVKHHPKNSLTELESDLDYIMADSQEKERILRICHLVRDADKLQNLEYLLFDSSNIIDYIKKGKTDREAKSVSETCLEVIRKKQLLDKKLAETSAELALYYYSWIYDIHFEGTKNALKQMKFKEQFAEVLTKMGVRKEVVDVVRG